MPCGVCRPKSERGAAHMIGLSIAPAAAVELRNGGRGSSPRALCAVEVDISAIAHTPTAAARRTTLLRRRCTFASTIDNLLELSHARAQRPTAGTNRRGCRSIDRGGTESLFGLPPPVQPVAEHSNDRRREL